MDKCCSTKAHSPSSRWRPSPAIQRVDAPRTTFSGMHQRSVDPRPERPDRRQTRYCGFSAEPKRPLAAWHSLLLPPHSIQPGRRETTFSADLATSINRWLIPFISFDQFVGQVGLTTIQVKLEAEPPRKSGMPIGRRAPDVFFSAPHVARSRDQVGQPPRRAHPPRGDFGATSGPEGPTAFGN